MVKQAIEYSDAITYRTQVRDAEFGDIVDALLVLATMIQASRATTRQLRELLKPDTCIAYPFCDVFYSRDPVIAGQNEAEGRPMSSREDEERQVKLLLLGLLLLAIFSLFVQREGGT